MAEVKWIKIVTDIFDDEKILLIEAMPDADSIITLWFKLLCLAGKQNNSGVFTLNDRIPYTDEMFATIFRRKLNTVRMALKTFEDLGMIEIVNGVVTIPNWGKHQSLEKIEARKEYMKKYNHDYYQRQKMLAGGESQTLDKSLNEFDKTFDKSFSSDPDIDIEEEKIREDKKESIKAAKRFTRPTFEEVEQYCYERKNKVNAQRFLDYYDSNGWKVGRNPMKDWKAAVRNWEREDGKPKQAEQAKKPMDERTVSDDDFGYDFSELMSRQRSKE